MTPFPDPFPTWILQYGLNVPERIEFGRGSLDRLPEIAQSIASSGPILLVTGSESARTSRICDRLHELFSVSEFTVAAHASTDSEPTTVVVDQGATLARDVAPTLVIAIGGGSVVDLGKAIAALAVNDGSAEDYLEGVGRGLSIQRNPLPTIAIPTTSGTGAEMTKNAVIANHPKGYKKSMRDDRMIPSVALLDPTLSLTLPGYITASSGMDALTQLIEPCISIHRQPGTTTLAHHALRLVLDALPACCTNPNNIRARSHMLQASSISGICLANSGLGLAHGIASGLGGLHPVAHGLICGILLPHVLRYNRDACETELAWVMAQFLREDDITHDTIDRGIETIERMKKDIGIQMDLSFLGLSDTQIRSISEHSMGSSMSGNPIPMTPESIYTFLRPLM